MLKFWSRFCFLVLAVSSLSSGKNNTAVSPPNGDPESLPYTQPPDGNQTETTSPMMPPSSSQSPTVNTTDELPTNTTTPEEIQTGGNTVNITTPKVAQTTQTTSVEKALNGNDNGNDGTVPSHANSTSSKAGYVILVLIILAIIILCGILYVLRRVSRTYSFDLQRPSPVNRPNEPVGTFEQVYLDDLDRPAPKDQATTDDLSPPPVVNGTTLPSEEKEPNGENAPQDQPDANGSPPSNTSPSLGDDPADKTSSPLGSANLLFDTVGEEQQNGNNNNPSVCSTDPFVEINLDEPAWCDQLFASPEASSSVLPFSPFSFSSSSTSS